MMKTCIILITLGFTQIVIGCEFTNVTNDGSYHVCPINLFRRKRALTEYTRWRATVETTPQFIVKVLDEDLTTASTKTVIAVNIQPVTRGGEKIIIGGVIVPPLTTAHAVTEGFRDYTRFVPRTTAVRLHTPSRVREDEYLAPKTPPDVIPPIKPNLPNVADRHAQRDESPPASPQFIVRSSSAAYARQYAPLAPVAFTRRTPVSERKPTTAYIFQEPLEVSEEVSPPTRTSEHPEIIWPQRTRPIFDFSDLTTTVDYDSAEVTTMKGVSYIMYNPIRTTTAKIDFDDEPVEPRQVLESLETIKHIKDTYERDSKKFDEVRKKLDEESKKYEEEYRKIKEEEEVMSTGERKSHDQITQKSNAKTSKEADNIYNMIFYRDEGNEINKKDEQDYDDKLKIDAELSVTSEKYVEDDDDDFATRKQQTIENLSETEFTAAVNNNSVKLQPTRRMFEDTESSTASTTERKKDSRRKICSLIKLRDLNFNAPHTLAEITHQLKHWAEKSPLVVLEDITNGNLTTMENPIYLMSVDDPSSGQIVSAKQTVMIVAGIQGRDHHAVTAAMYVLYQLIERSESHTDLLTKYRFWIIPVFNPDGYYYSMTFPHHQEWTKNLRQNWDVCKNRELCSYCESFGLRCTVQLCYGVNLDRNFEYQWIPADTLRSEHPCGPLYAGARQLSEAETRALTTYLHAKRMLLVTFIAFKEGEVLGVMYPYSHTRKLRTFDQIFRQRALRAASAAYSISGRPYVAGQTSEFLPLYAGGIEDWVDGHLGIDNTYTIMMFRPTDSYNSKLITERVVHEAYAAMDTLLLQSLGPATSPPSILKRVSSAPKQYSQYCLTTISTALLLSRLPVAK